MPEKVTWEARKEDEVICETETLKKLFEKVDDMGLERDEYRIRANVEVVNETS